MTDTKLTKKAVLKAIARARTLEDIDRVFEMVERYREQHGDDPAIRFEMESMHMLREAILITQKSEPGPVDSERRIL